MAHRVRQLQRGVEVVPVAVDERLAPHVPSQLAHELAGHVAVRVDPRLAQVRWLYDGCKMVVRWPVTLLTHSALGGVSLVWPHLATVRRGGSGARTLLKVHEAVAHARRDAARPEQGSEQHGVLAAVTAAGARLSGVMG